MIIGDFLLMTNLSANIYGYIYNVHKKPKSTLTTVTIGLNISNC